MLSPDGPAQPFHFSADRVAEASAMIADRVVLERRDHIAIKLVNSKGWLPIAPLFAPPVLKFAVFPEEFDGCSNTVAPIRFGFAHAAGSPARPHLSGAAMHGFVRDPENQ
jgi:hypothetical protein